MELRAGEAVAEVRPDAGGRIGQITVGGRRLLRGQEDTAHWAGWGCYPLAPWSNRIPGGVIHVDGVEHRVPVNGDDGTALHGLVADQPWDVLEHDGAAAVLAISVREGPYEVRVRHDIRLGDGAISLTLRVTNHGGLTVPAGLGYHPWFPAGPVTVPADLVWPAVGAIPTGFPVPVSGDRDLRGGRIPAPDLDDCFTGLTARRGRAPGVTVTWSPEVTCVVVYGGETGWVTLEPVTHANDGFNLRARGWPGHGVRPLQPGGELSVSMSIAWAEA